MSRLYLETFPDLDFSPVRPIGRIKGRQPARLMLAGPDPEVPGRLAFLREVDATWGVVEKSVRYKRSDEGEIVGDVAEWFRVEVQVPLGTPDVRPNMDVVIARQTAACWAEDAPFRKPDKKGSAARVDPLAEPLSGPEAVIERLESLDYDYWEHGDYLTAGISIPRESLRDDPRNFSRGDWFLGLCEDIDQDRQRLWDDPRIGELLDMTASKRLKFWPSSKEVKLAHCEYHSELADERHWMMQLAIRQALAGPHDDPPVGWFQRPVVDLVEHLYKDHLFNKNRVLVDNDLKLGQLLKTARRWQDEQNRRRGLRRRSKRDA
jgi:hypothetical protein